ncbi:glutathione S-transferase family protein [Castellaniella sp. S9]|uniref:glutathione S-transferase family protein n=1 Tax=Castellaniella sp. S9 TaxID=2993652 RepID=UPI0022B39E55|nr:glutathione S-transferase N-terminal domain-containing protein [Castellaniella sp. S9]
MKLYYFPGACPLATHIVLEWIGKPYEAVRITREQTKQAEYLALNPAGAVPTLVDGDFVLTQSSAILEYLAELNPEAGLLGDSPRERAETRRWLALCNADLHRTFALVFGASFYSGGDDKATGVLKAQATQKLLDLFTIAERRLEGRDWLTGRRSLADPYLYTVLRWADLLGIDLPGMDALRRFQARMQADAGVQAALAAQGLS